MLFKGAMCKILAGFELIIFVKNVPTLSKDCEDIRVLTWCQRGRCIVWQRCYWNELVLSCKTTCPSRGDSESLSRPVGSQSNTREWQSRAARGHINDRSMMCLRLIVLYWIKLKVPRGFFVGTACGGSRWWPWLQLARIQPEKTSPPGLQLPVWNWRL